jgi:uridine kinase
MYLSTPDAFDFGLLVDTLHKLKEGKHVDVPIYDFVTHSRAKYKVSTLASIHVHGANVAPLSNIMTFQTPMYGANVVIFEGIMAFVDKKLRDIMDLKVFVDTDPDVCLARR